MLAVFYQVSALETATVEKYSTRLVSRNHLLLTIHEPDESCDFPVAIFLSQCQVPIVLDTVDKYK